MPAVKIATQVRLLALGLVLLTAALLGVVVYWGFDSLIAQQQRTSVERLVDLEGRRLASAFDELIHDAAFLQALPAATELMHAPPEQQEQLRDELADQFAVMVLAKPMYEQIRLIGVADGGRELVRVDRAGDGTTRVSETQLQAKGTRHYFVGAIGLARDQVYVSPIDLNREHGEIEVPHRPVVRIARSLRDRNDRVFGVVVINVDFDALFDDLYGAEDTRYTYFLTNSAGDFLVHPDPSHQFGFDLGHRHLAQDQFPQLEDPFARRANESFARIPGAAVSFRRVAIPASHGPDAVYLGILAASTVTDRGTVEVATRALGFTIGLMVVAVFLAVFLSLLLVRPLRRITTAANTIASGNTSERLPVMRTDEIGVLARSFQHMVDVLGENEERLAATNERLQQANRDLSHFSHIAAHDLREPARRVATLADLVLFEEAQRLSPDGQQVLERMRACSEDMLRRITDLRALTGIGSSVPVRSQVSLDTLLDEILSEVASDLASRGVEVTRPDLPSLSLYRNLVAVLYRNLVANALQHSEPGAFRLTFAASQDDDGNWELAVHNTGSRIPDTRLETIFYPFTRLGTGGNTGIGLSICRRIAELHGGWIRATSKADGVEFRFHLGDTRDPANLPPKSDRHGRR